jgi:hypothetical protein
MNPGSGKHDGARSFLAHPSFEEVNGGENVAAEQREARL